jgi:hypothetical protein
VSNEAVFSSHASPSGKTFALPEGVEINFYTKAGTSLSHEEAIKIWVSLKEHGVPGRVPDHVVYGGQQTQDYNLWYLSEFPDYSGVFIMPKWTWATTLYGTTEQHPSSLSQIRYGYARDAKVLHFLGCR